MWDNRIHALEAKKIVDKFNRTEEAELKRLLEITYLKLIKKTNKEIKRIAKEGRSWTQIYTLSFFSENIAYGYRSLDLFERLYIDYVKRMFAYYSDFGYKVVEHKTTYNCYHEIRWDNL